MTALFKVLSKISHKVIYLLSLYLLLNTSLMPANTVYAKSTSKKAHHISLKQPKQTPLASLADHDSENTEQFVVMASLKLYGIYISFYNQVLRENVDDFDTALVILTEASDFSNKMATLVYSQQFKEFFISAKYFFNFKAQLIKQIAEETKNNKFRPEFNSLLLDIFIKGKDRTATLTPQEQMLFSKWNAQSQKIYQDTLQTSTNNLRDISDLYKINSLNYLDNISTSINFQLPLNNDVKEGEYIYTTYIKDTQFPNDVKLYYYHDFLQYAITVATIVGYNLIESIDLLLDKFAALGLAASGVGVAAILASGPVGISLAIVAYLTYKYILYKAGEVAEEIMENFVRQVYNSDQTIAKRVEQAQKSVVSLLEMENQVKKVIPTNDTKYFELQKLTNLTESYLTQRKQITRRALTNCLFSAGAMYVADTSNKIHDTIDFAQMAKKFFDNKDKIGNIGNLFNKYKFSERVIKNSSDDFIDREKNIDREAGNKGRFSVKSKSVTNLRINRGDNVTISATGRVSLGKTVGSCGPDGRETTVYEIGSLIVKRSGLSVARHGALLARVNAQGTEKWIIIGSNKTFKASNSGVLELQVNDENDNDNEDGFDVQVKITRTQ